MAKINTRFLVNRADANRVLLFAITAAPEIPFAPRTRLGIRHFIDADATTMDAGRAIIPSLTFKKFNRRQFIRASERDVINNG